MRSSFYRYSIAASLAVMLAGCSVNSPNSAPEASGVKSAVVEKEGYHIPATNCEVRDWYNYQVVAIPAINKRWVKNGLGAAERARRAFNLRHQARINARFMMPDQSEVKGLQERDKKKYGNPDGPTLPYLVKKLRTKGMEDKQVFDNIIASSSRTSAKYNDKCVKPQ